MNESQRFEQKRRTRERLIEAALPLLARDGLMAARTGDIAKAAEVSHGTVFLHFPTRNDLLIAVIEQFGERLTRRLHELNRGELALGQVLQAHLQGLAEFEDFYTRMVIEGPLLPDEAQQTLLMVQSAVSFHLIQAAERQMAAGEIRLLPLHLLFNTWLGLIHHYLINRRWFAPEGKVLERYGPELTAYYLHLITNPKVAESAGRIITDAPI